MQTQLPLAGKSILVIEDEALIALNVETALKEAGASVVVTAGSVAQAQHAIGNSICFDTAVVDLHLTDGDASPLIGVLSARGIAVIVTTGGSIEPVQPDLSQAIAVLQKPYRESDLINSIISLTKDPLS